METTPSLADLIEVLEKAQGALTKPKLKELASQVGTMLFDPISEVLTTQFGCEELSRGAIKNDPHKVYVGRLLFVVPEPEKIFTPLRLALEKRASTGKRTGKYHPAYLGVVVANRIDEESDTGHDVHIRWGFWTGASTGQEGALIPPFMALRRRIDPEEENFARPFHRGITGVTTRGWWMTFFGRVLELDEIRALDSLEELLGKIVADLAQINGALDR